MIHGLSPRWFRGFCILLFLAMAFWSGWAGLVHGRGEESKSPRPSSDSPEAALALQPAVEAKAGASPQATDVRQITFDDLNLDLKKSQAFDASQLPEKVKQFDGKTIRIRGFILPSFKAHGITQFVLCRGHDLDPLDKCVVVDLTPPTTANFVVHAIDVEGVFSLRELKTEDGTVIAIYHLEGKKVVLVPGVRAPPSKNGC